MVEMYPVIVDCGGYINDDSPPVHQVEQKLTCRHHNERELGGDESDFCSGRDCVTGRWGSPFEPLRHLQEHPWAEQVVRREHYLPLRHTRPTMRDSNYSYPLQNKVCVGISPSLYDRRGEIRYFPVPIARRSCSRGNHLSDLTALDTSAMLPLLNSLTHLTYLTSTSPRIRDILVNDGGLERLLEIMQEAALPRDDCLEPSFDWFGLRGPPTASILTQAQQMALKHSLAFQCVVNIGVRGSETIRTRLVQSGALNVVAQIMEVWLQQKGVWIYPGPLGSQVSVERAIAAGVLPPVQDGSVDWRAGYSKMSSRRTRDKDRERSGRDGTAAEGPGLEGEQEPGLQEMSVDDTAGNASRASRRAPSGRERHERVSAWVEGRNGRAEDDLRSGPEGSRQSRDGNPYPIAAWWDTIRRGIEMNMLREDIPTDEDVNLFGITPATIPAWTRLFASIRSSGDNRRRLIRRLLRGDTSAQSIMEVMFMLGLDPWETRERLKRAVRVSAQGEVMIVTTHQHLGPSATPAEGSRHRQAVAPTSTPITRATSQPTQSGQAVYQTRSTTQRMQHVAADNAPPSLPPPRSSGNGVTASETASISASSAIQIPATPGSGRNRQHARRTVNTGLGESSHETGRDSSAAPSSSGSAPDGNHQQDGQEEASRVTSRNGLAPRPDSAASSRSTSRVGHRNLHLLEAGDANSSGPSNNPSPLATPTIDPMGRGSTVTLRAVPDQMAGGRAPPRERSGTITMATGFQIDASAEALNQRLASGGRAPTHEAMDIDDDDRPASRATTDAEVNAEGMEGDDLATDESIDIVGINGEEETGDPMMNILTEVEPNPDAQAELDIAMGAPRGAPGAAATTVAGEMTPRVPAPGLPMTAGTMTSPEPVDNRDIGDEDDVGTETQRQPVRQPQLPVTAVVIAAGAPRSFSDLGHLVASMDRNVDPHSYTDDTILLSLQLFAYLSKYPHVRSAFHHPTRPLHYGVEISSDAKLPERPNFSKTSNMFSLVERFTFRAAPPDPDMPKIPSDIQYWAGVIMRNACRKDDSRNGIRQCANMSCGKWEAYPRQFAKCRRCRKAKYCSKDCQSRAWQEGHRFW